MPGPAPGQPPAVVLQTGGRRWGVLLTSPCSWRGPRAKAGGKVGACVPAVLLCHVGLSQGLVYSNPNHL